MSIIRQFSKLYCILNERLCVFELTLIIIKLVNLNIIIKNALFRFHILL